jgi:hypothetical protein
MSIKALNRSRRSGRMGRVRSAAKLFRGRLHVFRSDSLRETRRKRYCKGKGTQFAASESATDSVSFSLRATRLDHRQR